MYGSNRGHDSIVIFAVEAETGQLSLVGHEPTQGKTPRYFVISPTGSFLLVANKDSDNVVCFKIDEHTGALGYLQRINVPKPVCIKFLTAGLGIHHL